MSGPRSMIDAPPSEAQERLRQPSNLEESPPREKSEDTGFPGKGGKFLADGAGEFRLLRRYQKGHYLPGGAESAVACHAGSLTTTQLRH